MCETQVLYLELKGIFNQFNITLENKRDILEFY